MRILEQDARFRAYIYDAIQQTNIAPAMVDISDAANWFWAESPQDNWDLATDMHALTLPNKVTYLEYAIPSAMNVNGTMEKSGLTGKRAGCIALCLEIENEKRIDAQRNWMLEAFLVAPEPDRKLYFERLQKDKEWQEKRETGLVNGIIPSFLLDATVLISDGKKTIRMIRVTMYLDEQGKAYPGEQGTMLLSAHLPGLSEKHAPLSGFLPFAFAISLMNCRNVELIDDRRVLSRNQRRRMERDKQPIITYKWLHIKQFQKRVDSDMEHQKTGRHNRLHFVRAHWATYTADAPLFGKYEGVFFKPSHVKGRLSSGVALKDYKVDAP